MRPKAQPGFLLAEALLGIALMTLLLGALLATQTGFLHFNDYELSRQRCTAACQGQLDSLSRTAKAVDASEIGRLWPGVRVALESRPGTGDWTGLELVKATAAADSHGRPIRVTLSAYMWPGRGN